MKIYSIVASWICYTNFVHISTISPDKLLKYPPALMNCLSTPRSMQFQRDVSVQLPTPGGASTAESIPSSDLASHF